MVRCRRRCLRGIECDSERVHSKVVQSRHIAAGAALMSGIHAASAFLGPSFTAG